MVDQTTEESSRSSTDRTTDDIQTDERTSDFTETQTDYPIGTSTDQQTDIISTKTSTGAPSIGTTPTEITTGNSTNGQTGNKKRRTDGFPEFILSFI